MGIEEMKIFIKEYIMNNRNTYEQQEKCLSDRSQKFIEYLTRRGLLPERKLHDEKSAARRQELAKKAYHNTEMLLYSYREMVWALKTIIEGMMLGVGKTKQPFIYNIIGMWGVRIVGTWICTQLLPFGLVAAWACMIAHNMLLFFLFLINYVRGSWNPLHEKVIV